jgi:hypothetical protein
MIPPQEDHADELDVSHHSCIDGRGNAAWNGRSPVDGRYGTPCPNSARDATMAWLTAASGDAADRRRTTHWGALVA